MQVKQLSFRATTFLIVFFLLDLVVGEILRLAYFSQENKYNYGILKTEAEIIIVGSSRANSHYIPSVFSDTLGISCFNMGSGGQNIYYYYGIIGSILERYKPRIIIMDVMGSDIEIRDDASDRLSAFLPFYRSSQSIKEMINLRGPVERIKLLSGVYPFNSQVTSIIYSLIKKGENPHLIMGGYIPLDGKISLPIVTAAREEKVFLDSFKVKLVEKIALLCQQNDIQLLIIVSPIFAKFNDKSSSIESLKEIISKYDIEVWDYEQNPYFLSNGALFRDELHLNHKGAIEYSKTIASRIEQVYFGGK
jgi:hypothetical protein